MTATANATAARTDKWRAALAALVAVAVVATVAIGFAPPSAQAQPDVFGCRPEWRLSFSDDFDGSSVDTDAWQVYDSVGHDGNGFRRPSAVTVEQGLLKITARDSPIGQVISGGLATRQRFTHARFEARVRTQKDDTGTTSGVIIAWPTVQNNDGHYTEINLYETGREPDRTPLDFWVHYDVPNKPDRPHFIADVDASVWHDVSADWTDSEIIFRLNGDEVGRTARPEVIPDRPHAMTIQLDAFADRLGGPDPVVMEVDFARVWSWDPTGDPTCRVDVPGAEAPVEVAHNVSCLAGNARVDTNIVNTGTDAAVYRIEYEGLTPRQFGVAAGDWWRMPITGRRDGTPRVIVRRDGQVVSDRHLLITCDLRSPLVSPDEVQVINACRNGSGYLIFQLNNPGAAMRSWVREFDTLRNRSTSAVAAAQAVTAVTGRFDRRYPVLIRSGSLIRARFEVDVRCDSERLPTLSGLVTGLDGIPVVGASVALFERDGDGRGPLVGSLVTDNRGSYAWSIPSGCYVVVVDAPGVGFFDPVDQSADEQQHEVCVTTHATVPTSVVFEPLDVTGLGGELSLPDGQPVDDLTINLFIADGNGRKGPFLGAAQTDSNGRWNLSVVAGCYVVVVIADAGVSHSPDEYVQFRELRTCTGFAGSDLDLTVYEQP